MRGYVLTKIKNEVRDMDKTISELDAKVRKAKFNKISISAEDDKIIEKTISSYKKRINEIEAILKRRMEILAM